MKTILVVEDDEGNGLLIAQLVSQEIGCHAVLVRDSREALYVANTIKPELFILDYRLPFMSGIELYDLLHAQEELQHIPAVVISAALQNEVTQQAEERKLFFLSKPFELYEFLETIQTALAVQSALTLSFAHSSSRDEY